MKRKDIKLPCVGTEMFSSSIFFTHFEQSPFTYISFFTEIQVYFLFSLKDGLIYILL